MPKYTVNGKTISAERQLTDDELEELFGTAPTAQKQQPTGSWLDKFKGTPDWMVSKPGQGWDDANAPAAGGDVTNPMAYLSEAQKEEQGAAAKLAGKAVNRGVQIGAGIAKGAVLNPVAATAELLGGQGGRDFSAAMAESYAQQRKNAGAEGFDFAELVGAVASPVNKLIPAVATEGNLLQKVGSAAATGAAGSVFNPVVTKEGMTEEEYDAEKLKQLGFGAIGGAAVSSLIPAFKAGARELLDKGMELSTGQAFGGLGGALARRTEGIVDAAKRLLGKEATEEKINRAFSIATVDDIVNSVGKTLPTKTVVDGQTAVNQGVKAIRSAYTDAFNKIGVVDVDKQFASEINGILSKAKTMFDDPKDYDSFVKAVKNNIESKYTKTAQDQVVKNTVDGKALQEMKRWIQARSRNLSSATEDVALSKKELFQEIDDAFSNFAYRVDESGSLRAVDKAYADIYRVAAAAKSAVQNNGNFSPSQLANAASGQTTTLQGGGGEGPMQQYAKQAMRIIGNDNSRIAGSSITPSDLKNLGVAAGLGYTGLFSLPVIAGLGATGLTAETLGKLAMKDPTKYEAIRKELIKRSGMITGAAGTQ